jgi:hypothetical protein
MRMSHPVNSLVGIEHAALAEQACSLYVYSAISMIAGNTLAENI